MKIGILALQGAVSPHEAKLRLLGIDTVEVRRETDLGGLSGIILPGGESTTMLHLLGINQLWEPLLRFTCERPTWGICAGAILLAKEVHHPAQKSLEQLDIAVDRNAYGRQIDSFIDKLTATEHWEGPKEVEGVFIRAPRIRSIGSDTRVLFNHGHEAVMVESKHLLASTFHPELTNSTTLHEYFLKKCHS